MTLPPPRATSAEKKEINETSESSCFCFVFIVGSSDHVSSLIIDGLMNYRFNNSLRPPPTHRDWRSGTPRRWLSIDFFLVVEIKKEEHFFFCGRTPIGREVSAGDQWRRSIARERASVTTAASSETKKSRRWTRFDRVEQPQQRWQSSGAGSGDVKEKPPAKRPTTEFLASKKEKITPKTKRRRRRRRRRRRWWWW